MCCQICLQICISEMKEMHFPHEFLNKVYFDCFRCSRLPKLSKKLKGALVLFHFSNNNWVSKGNDIARSLSCFFRKRIIYNTALSSGPYLDQLLRVMKLNALTFIGFVSTKSLIIFQLWWYQELNIRSEHNSYPAVLNKEVYFLLFCIMNEIH